jgi:hypothetical protein
MAVALLLQDTVAAVKLEQTISMVWVSMALLIWDNEILRSWQVMVSL